MSGHKRVLREATPRAVGTVVSKKSEKTMSEPETAAATADTTLDAIADATPDAVAALRLRVQQLETENAAMRPIVLRMAEARMCRDTVTMIESCPHCSLKRGGDFGYTGQHDATCVVTLARALGF